MPIQLMDRLRDGKPRDRHGLHRPARMAQRGMTPLQQGLGIFHEAMEPRFVQVEKGLIADPRLQAH